ncbi:MAG: hypothetical protein QXE31_05610 [Candidatus Woesearchaeota archaeon]
MAKGLYYSLASAVVATTMVLSACTPRNNAQGHVELTNRQPPITQTYEPTGTATPFQPQTYTPRTLPSYTPTQNPPTATITATQLSQLEIMVSLDEKAQSLYVIDDGVIDTNEQTTFKWFPGYHTLVLNLPFLSNGKYILQGDNGSYELVYNQKTGNYELPASQKWNPWNLTNSQSDAKLKIVGPNGDVIRLIFSFQAPKSTPTPGSSGNSDSGNDGNPGQNPGQPGQPTTEPTLPPPPPPQPTTEPGS